jgi:hypothetical protein
MKAFISVVLGGLLALAIPAAAVRAEDFSVHLDQEADIDAARAVPELTVEKRLTATRTDTAFDMPEKTYDVFLRLKEFGDVRLGEATEIGPAPNDKLWRKGMTGEAGVDKASVRAGWLKGSPDILVVAWVEDPDMRGNGLISYHAYAFLRLKGGRAECLMRRSQACNVRGNDFDDGEPLESSRFSYDAGQGLLVETITSGRCVPAEKGGYPLARSFKDESGEEHFSAAIRERITLSYKPVAADVPQVVTATLAYETEDGDELGEISRFYFGRQAARQVLLDANPDLAAKYRNVKPADSIHLGAKVHVKIPVAREWFTQRWNVTLAPSSAKDAPAASGSAR